jgi:VHL beta domain
VNDHGAPVQLYWLDYGGQRKLYMTIAPGQSFTQPTYVTHPWVATDLSGKCIAIYLPDAQPRQMSVR